MEFEADTIREEYAEYSAGEGGFGVFPDPENRRTWIRSIETVDVEPEPATHYLLANR